MPLLYVFTVSVNQGAMGDVKGAYLLLQEVPGLVRKKNNQLEAFVAKSVCVKF